MTCNLLGGMLNFSLLHLIAEQ